MLVMKSSKVTYTDFVEIRKFSKICQNKPFRVLKLYYNSHNRFLHLKLPY